MKLNQLKNEKAKEDSIMDTENYVSRDREVIVRAAIVEIEEERFRRAVEREKEKLRRPFWLRIFPWRLRVSIERR